MTIDEAIKQLGHVADKAHRFNWLTDERAVKLGIEALKRVENSRTLNPLLPDEPLPDETIEKE